VSVVVRYLPVALLFALWELSSRLEWVSSDVLPAFSDVIHQWWQLLASGELVTHSIASLLRESTGLGLSIVVGVALGVGMALWKPLQRLVQPFITFFYPLPKSALIPVIIIWFGLGHSAQIAVVFLGCLLPVVLSSFNGANGVDSVLVWSAQSLGASRWRTIWDVVVRAALPEIFAGVRVALALSFVLLVSAEMIGARQGIGYLIAFLGEQGEYAGMFAAIFTLIAFGFTADRLYLAFVRRVLRWREA
jgi:NitT/TauT family transport system permease protein